jgi:hypothetical protein
MPSLEGYSYIIASVVFAAFLLPGMESIIKYCTDFTSRQSQSQLFSAAINYQHNFQKRTILLDREINLRN